MHYHPSSIIFIIIVLYTIRIHGEINTERPSAPVLYTRSYMSVLPSFLSSSSTWSLVYNIITKIVPTYISSSHVMPSSSLKPEYLHQTWSLLYVRNQKVVADTAELILYLVLTDRSVELVLFSNSLWQGGPCN